MPSLPSEALPAGMLPVTRQLSLLAALAPLPSRCSCTFSCRKGTQQQQCIENMLDFSSTLEAWVHRARRDRLQV